MVPPKITLAAPETVPLDKLEIHEDNVRKAAEAKGAIEDLAADIAARGLLQSLSVRPLLDADGQETGRYGVQAGGRRYLALKHLVKQKKLAKNAPIPCIAKSEGFAEADSLAENTQRQALTPLDEFRAFKALADKGQGEETIAAAFRVSTLVVRQRLRLANASPVILKAYEDDELSLEQLYAYCLTDNHARQEQVFEALSSYWNKGPDQIRRLLTEKAIPADDKRVHFIGIDAYLAAGGSIERDLFSDEDEGYLIDPDLVNRLAGEKLSLEAKKIRAEGWAWVEAAADFAWNHRRDFRAITPISPALSGEEQDEYETLAHEFDNPSRRQTGRPKTASAWLPSRPGSPDLAPSKRSIRTNRRRRPALSSASIPAAHCSPNAATGATRTSLPMRTAKPLPLAMAMIRMPVTTACCTKTAKPPALPAFMARQLPTKKRALSFPASF